MKGSGLDRAQLPTHGRVCATTDGKSTSSPDQRGREPQLGESKTRMGPSSTQANASSRPDTTWFAYQDCLLALRELGYDDIADIVEKRWFDVEAA